MSGRSVNDGLPKMLAGMFGKCLRRKFSTTASIVCSRQDELNRSHLFNVSSSHAFELPSFIFGHQQHYYCISRKSYYHKSTFCITSSHTSSHHSQPFMAGCSTHHSAARLDILSVRIALLSLPHNPILNRLSLLYFFRLPFGWN